MVNNPFRAAEGPAREPRQPATSGSRHAKPGRISAGCVQIKRLDRWEQPVVPRSRLAASTIGHVCGRIAEGPSGVDLVNDPPKSRSEWRGLGGTFSKRENTSRIAMHPPSHQTLGRAGQANCFARGAIEVDGAVSSAVFRNDPEASRTGRNGQRPQRRSVSLPWELRSAGPSARTARPSREVR